MIDLDAVVYTQSDVQTAIQRLATIGYVHEGDLGITGREAFIPPDGTPSRKTPHPVASRVSSFLRVTAYK
nr:GrpB family protein [Alicyclobacillus macrosporangiidus]